MSEPDTRPPMRLDPPPEEIRDAIFAEDTPHCLVSGWLLRDGSINGRIHFAGTEDECEEEMASQCGQLWITLEGTEPICHMYEVSEFRELLS